MNVEFLDESVLCHSLKSFPDFLDSFDNLNSKEKEATKTAAKELFAAKPLVDYDPKFLVFPGTDKYGCTHAVMCGIVKRLGYRVFSLQAVHVIIWKNGSVQNKHTATSKEYHEEDCGDLFKDYLKLVSRIRKISSIDGLLSFWEGDLMRMFYGMP